jgi:L-lactate dehydrogenase complex protein LldE
VPSAAPRQAQLFVTCLLDALFPEVAAAVVRVLGSLGVEVIVPSGQTCCGQPGFNAGFQAEARRLARRHIALFERSPAPVVTSSGSCAAMLVHGYPQLFADDPAALQRARALAARTYEFSQFLVDVLRVDAADLGRRSAFRGPATYHASCHLLRGLGVRDAAIDLLRGVPGLDYVPLREAEECCGFGGLFAVKHAAISAAMLDRKLENVRASGAPVVVAADMSCLMHIQGALARDRSPVRCLHLAQVLAA